ncbi:MAG TPA: PfkB family carbohydrate kinase, partial [Chloroflexota bacterium]|nr:PfkB family carbohydrate kinase [Chloroflexota bacterium]
MSSLVVGSIALDTVETPYGRVEEALGGTAVYFSIAASVFTDVKIVGVVGHDFPDGHVTALERRGCDLEGLQRQEGRTFRWVGSYDENMNVAHTLDTQLNVFESFRPELPLSYRRSRTLFLGNIDPELQLDVLEQTSAPTITALDTMNFWIERKREALEEVVRRVDVVLVNEEEARQFAGVYHIAEAARRIRAYGPHSVVIKRGEYGAVMFTDDCYFALPAFPSDEVRDTTGAGDSFAGGFLGYLDTVDTIDSRELRCALAFGTVMASFTVENFSILGLQEAILPQIESRYEALRELTAIEPA